MKEGKGRASRVGHYTMGRGLCTWETAGPERWGAVRGDEVGVVGRSPTVTDSVGALLGFSFLEPWDTREDL